MSQSGDTEGVRRAWTIRGRVQGVGFRWWTRRTAEGLGVHGWVRNRGDGSVEVRASGSADAVEVFEAELWRGPSSARVEEVVAMDVEDEVRTNGFEIVR